MKQKRTLIAASLLATTLTVSVNGTYADNGKFSEGNKEITVELSPGGTISVDVACRGNSRALGASFFSEPHSGANALSVIASHAIATNEWRITWQQRSPLDQIYTLTVSSVCNSGN